MLEKLTGWQLGYNRSGPIDIDELSALELEVKSAKKIDEMVDEVNQKTDVMGDHKGTWQGYHPVETSPGIQAMVNDHETRVTVLEQRPVYNAFISFIFDDGNTYNTTTKAIFDGFGYPVDFALIADNVLITDMCPVNSFRDWEEKGSCILCHSASHTDLSSGTYSQMVADHEIRHSGQLLKEYGFNIRGFVSAYSVMHSSYMDKVRNNYDYAFTVGQFYRGDGSAHNTYNESPHLLHRLNLTEDISSIMTAVDKVCAQGGWLTFYDHNTDQVGSATSAKLTQVLNYVKTKVDANLCKVLNSNQCYSALYRMGTKQRQVICKKRDMLLDKNLSSSNWTFSKHNGDYGQTLINRTGYYEVKFLNGTPQGLTQSIQYTTADAWQDILNTHEFSMEFWGDSDKFNITLEIYYLDSSGNTLSTYVSPVLPCSGQRRDIFKYRATVQAISGIAKMKIFPRITTNVPLPTGGSLYISNPNFSEVMREYII